MFSACRLPDKTNCPASNGPDFDFSASPILVSLANGKRALIAGQKSGMVHALDPDQQGKILWQARVGLGGTMGGVQWGSASDGTNIYVANSDIGRVMLTYSTSTDADPKRGGGIYALRASDGKQVWYAPSRILWRPASVQSGAICRRECDSRRRILRIGGWASARIFDSRWKNHLGFRYRTEFQDGKRRSRPRRIDRRTGRNDRRRNAVYQLRICVGGRRAGQCTAGVLGRRKVIRACECKRRASMTRAK